MSLLPHRELELELGDSIFELCIAFDRRRGEVYMNMSVERASKPNEVV